MSNKPGRFKGVPAETKAEILEFEQGRKELVEELREAIEDFQDYIAPYGEDAKFEGEGASIDLEGGNVVDLEGALKSQKDDGGSATWGEVFGTDEEGASHAEMELRATEIENFLKNFSGKNKQLPPGRADVGALVKFVESNLGTNKWDDKKVESMAWKMAKAGDLDTWLKRSNKYEGKVRQEIRQALADYNTKKLAGGKSDKVDKSSDISTRAHHLKEAGVKIDVGVEKDTYIDSKGREIELETATVHTENFNREGNLKKISEYVAKDAGSKQRLDRINELAKALGRTGEVAKQKNWAETKLYQKAREMARQSIPERLKSGGRQAMSLRQIFMGQTRKDPSLKAGTRIGHKPERVKHERKMSAKQISNYEKSKAKSSKAKPAKSKTKKK